MAAPPTRSGGASLPGPEASADASSLRAYLAKDTHARVLRLSADEFTSWLERETLDRLHRDRPAALRARADATRRFHRDTLFPLEAAVAAADAAFDASDDRALISGAEKALVRAYAAIEGITAHLAREDAASEPGKGPRGLAPGIAGDETEKIDETATVAKKRAATVARLDAARASLPGLRSALETSVSASRLYREREAARAALRDARARTGLDAAEFEAGSAEKRAGAESGALGAAFEEAGLRAVARLIREGRFEVPGMRDERSDDDALFMLRNVSLGMGLGELDGALVRVRDAARAFASSPSRRRATREPPRAAQPAAETADARTPSSRPHAPPVEVLAVFECKRNPDDARRGYLRRRADLGWLAGAAGDSESLGAAYDPKRYVNRHHPTGHFVRGTHPTRRMERVRAGGRGSAHRERDKEKKDEETSDAGAEDAAEARAEPVPKGDSLVVTAASFRRFATGAAETHAGHDFPGSLCLVTRPRAMCGLDTKVRRGATRSRRDASSAFGFFFDGGRIWGALVEGLSGSSSLSASFIAPPRITRGTLRRTREALPSRALLFRDPHSRRVFATRLCETFSKRTQSHISRSFSFRHPASRTQVRAPLMQRSCARAASHVFETRGECLSADAFGSEIAALRELVSTDPSGARRTALREALAPLRRWLVEMEIARDDETGGFGFKDREGHRVALDDAASVFELYLDAAEGSDLSASVGVVLVDV